MSSGERGLHLFASDWFAEETFKLIRWQTRLIWCELLIFMSSKTDEYGRLVINGQSPPIDRLARLLSIPAKELAQALEELKAEGVCSVDNGIVYCRRMVRDQQRRTIMRERGKLGGNPALRPQLNQQDNLPLNQPEQPPDNPALNHSLSRRRARETRAPTHAPRPTHSYPTHTDPEESSSPPSQPETGGDPEHSLSLKDGEGRNGSEERGTGPVPIGDHLATLGQARRRITSGEALARLRGLAVAQGFLPPEGQDVHIAAWLKASPAARSRLDAALAANELQPSLMREVILQAKQDWIAANRTA